VSAGCHDRLVTDAQLGAALRTLRIRQGHTQGELAIAAGVPRSVVGLVERGRLAQCDLRSIRAIAAALDCTIVLSPRWQGGDLGRLLNARHSAMHEALAARFVALDGWILDPEVSFSIYGERGVIDALAWHAASGNLLVIELKTEFVDVNDLMGSVDRKRRMSTRVVADRGWRVEGVSTWVVVADGRTNRRALARHKLTLRTKFAADGHAIGAWLRHPNGTINALGFLPVDGLAGSGVAVSGSRRVRPAWTPVAAPPTPAS
jgi:transcriptional regulator with XRE-family HTH domain